MQSSIPRIRPARPGGALCFAFVATALAACGNHSAPTTGGTPPTPNEIPASVSIQGGQLTSGTARGTLRQNYSMSAINVSRYPTTVAQYRECVAAGACSEPASQRAECLSPGRRSYLDQATYGIKGGDAFPVTCALAEQARTYCQWVGGDLPTMTQWELAARGSQPTEFPWGATPPTCAQHPAVGESAALSPCARDAAKLTAAHSVGAHAAGASPSGVQDILLTRGEILLASADAQFPVCAPPMTGCIVSGSLPGAIESFAPIASHSAESEKGSPGITSGFRCVWSNPQ